MDDALKYILTGILASPIPLNLPTKAREIFPKYKTAYLTPLLKLLQRLSSTLTTKIQIPAAGLAALHDLAFAYCLELSPCILSITHLEPPFFLSSLLQPFCPHSLWGLLSSLCLIHAAWLDYLCPSGLSLNATSSGWFSLTNHQVTHGPMKFTYLSSAILWQ